MAWVSAADVATWANYQLMEGDAEVMTAVIASVEASLAQGYDIPSLPDPPDAELSAVWPDIAQAITMQAARLFGRRKTPEGVQGFGESFVYRVSNFDPDIAEALNAYRKWNFA